MEWESKLEDIYVLNFYAKLYSRDVWIFYVKNYGNKIFIQFINVAFMHKVEIINQIGVYQVNIYGLNMTSQYKSDWIMCYLVEVPEIYKK